MGRCRIDGNSGRPSPIVPTVVSVLGVLRHISSTLASPLKGYRSYTRSDRSLGVRSFNSVVRNAYEGRLLGIGSSPNAVQEVCLPLFTSS